VLTVSFPITERRVSLTKARIEMIEVGGRVCQFLGIPRTTGQVYGLLYLAPRPLSLDDIAESLGISRASVSTGTRLLLAWRAIRVSWVPGERRDHFEIEPDLTNLLRISYKDVIERRFLASQNRIERISGSLEEERADGVATHEDYEFCYGRLKAIEEIQKKLQALLPLLEKLL